MNLLQKDIGQIKKNKGDATELLAKKADLDKRISDLTTEVALLGKKRDARAQMIGNIVDKDCHVSSTEVSFGFMTCVFSAGSARVRTLDIS